MGSCHLVPISAGCWLFFLSPSQNFLFLQILVLLSSLLLFSTYGILFPLFLSLFLQVFILFFFSKPSTTTTNQLNMLTDAITWIQSIQLFVEKEELYKLFTDQDHLTDNTFIHISKFDFLPKLLLVFPLCDTWALHIPGKQKGEERMPLKITFKFWLLSYCIFLSLQNTWRVNIVSVTQTRRYHY